MKKEKIQEAVKNAEGEISEEDAVALIASKGYDIEKPCPTEPGKKFKFSKKKFSGKTFSIGSISCTQLGSRAQQLTSLKEYYKVVADMGVKLVLHSGDLVDGEKVYKGHEYEIFKHGATAQKEYVQEVYPNEDGVETYVISGNHDLSFFKTAGYDIIEEIAKDRKDMTYLGAYVADIEIMGVTIRLMHGAGGNSYARSYKMQKIIEQCAPESKPDVLLLGHYHTNCILPEYRNVIGLQLGCFQGQTDYLKRKGLYPEVGGWVLNFTVNDIGRKGNKVKIDFQYIPFYQMLEKDY